MSVPHSRVPHSLFGFYAAIQAIGLNFCFVVKEFKARREEERNNQIKFSMQHATMAIYCFLSYMPEASNSSQC